MEITVRKTVEMTNNIEIFHSGHLLLTINFQKDKCKPLFMAALSVNEQKAEST